MQRKQLLKKYMVLKRMRQVLRAEKKWITTVRQELNVYPKKMFFRYWKVHSGMCKIEKGRMLFLSYINLYYRTSKNEAIIHRRTENTLYGAKTKRTGCYCS